MKLPVVLPDELVLGIVDIAGGIGAIADRKDITVSVVGVGIAIIAADLAGGFAGGGCGVGGIFRKDHRIAVFGHLPGDTAQGIVGIVDCNAVGIHRGDPVIVIVGIAEVFGDIVGDLRHVCHIIVFVVGKLDNMIRSRGVRPVPGWAVDRIVKISRAYAGFRIHRSGKFAVPVVSIADRLTILIGLLDDPPLGIVGVLHIVPVAVSQLWARDRKLPLAATQDREPSPVFPYLSSGDNRIVPLSLRPFKLFFKIIVTPRANPYATIFCTVTLF